MPIQFDYKGKTYFGEVEVIGATTWYYIDGMTWSETTDEGMRRRNRKMQGKSQSGRVISPMPGKVTKLFVKDGESVEVGQSLLMMEAMKMEYTLKAEVPGEVQRVQLKEGDQVGLGQILIEIAEVSLGK